MLDESKDILRIEELRAVLRENSRRYYVDNNPLISDFEYDSLMRELEDLEALHPELATPDSPTRKVGSDLETQGFGENAESGIRMDFVQRPHRYPMLSLANTYSISEIEEFAARADKTLGKGFTYCMELKFDGTAICLTYKNGELYRALTRGDGVQGDDVTRNVRMIPNIPLKLRGDYPPDLEIRGEILMPYKDFERLNAEREEAGEIPFANPRNAASGSLKLMDPTQVAHRGLYCTLYHIPAQSVTFSTHDEALKSAADWGLPVSENRKICTDIAGIKEYIDYWDKERRFLPYATDGIVIKINELDAQRTLGYTSKSPRWAVAFKFKAEQACTRLNSIDYQVGRSGAVTPVANLEPVLLSGTVVKRATLNNEDQMTLLDIRVGDFVFVEKGGEIIPKITGVDFSRRTPGLASPIFPTVCPDCGTVLVRKDGEAKSFCPNTYSCPQQIKGRILNFMSRKAMNIIGGKSLVDQLVNKGLVKSPADLYYLSKYELLSLEGWKERSAERFLASLQESKQAGFERVLFALGIPFVGETTAKTLARHFKSIDRLMAAECPELEEVSDVGPVIAPSVIEFLGMESHREEIERLRAFGLRFEISQESGLLSNSLEGKTIVISGNFSVSREQIKELIGLHGGKNSGSVSAKTSFLLAGEKPGPEKLKKCAQLQIPVLDEAAFRAMLPDFGGIAGQAHNDAGAAQSVIEPTLF